MKVVNIMIFFTLVLASVVWADDSKFEYVKCTAHNNSINIYEIDKLSKEKAAKGDPQALRVISEIMEEARKDTNTEIPCGWVKVHEIIMRKVVKTASCPYDIR
jgi:hypothetical protein